MSKCELGIIEDGPKLGPRKATGLARDFTEGVARPGSHTSCFSHYLENVRSLLLVGKWASYAQVETAGSHQCCINELRAVGGGEHENSERT